MKSILGSTSCLIAVALWLSGCASVDTIDDIAATGSITRLADANRPSLVVDVPVTQALVHVPESLGTVIAVSEQRDVHNGKTVSIAQRITLKGDAGTLGENTISVALRRLPPGEAVTPFTDADLTAARDEAFARLTPVAAHSIIATGLGRMAVAEATGPAQRCAIALGRSQSASDAIGFQGGAQMEVKARLCLGTKSFAAIEAGLSGLALRGGPAPALLVGLEPPHRASGDPLNAAGASAKPVQSDISPEKITRRKASVQVAADIRRNDPRPSSSVVVPLPDRALGEPKQASASESVGNRAASTAAVPMP